MHVPLMEMVYIQTGNIYVNKYPTENNSIKEKTSKNTINSYCIRQSFDLYSFTFDKIITLKYILCVSEGPFKLLNLHPCK
jgi:hypothetical protein